MCNLVTNQIKSAGNLNREGGAMEDPIPEPALLYPQGKFSNGGSEAVSVFNSTSGSVSSRFF